MSMSFSEIMIVLLLFFEREYLTEYFFPSNDILHSHSQRSPRGKYVSDFCLSFLFFKTLWNIK